MIDKEQVQAFMTAEFPQSSIVIESCGDRQARIRGPVSTTDLRPGGTVSGPFMMALVDTALYVTILSELGLVALAVTTSLNINFLHRPAADKDVIAECTLLKMGKRLVVGEVTLYSEGQEEPIAHGVATYSIPPVAKV